MEKHCGMSAERWPSCGHTPPQLAKMFRTLKGEYKGKAMEMPFDTKVTGLLGASFGSRQV